MSAYKNQNPSKWANANFSKVHTTDIRRTKRIINLATKMAKSPGESIPQLADSYSEAKAYYNLFDHIESTPENLQRGHRELVFEELYKPGEYLLIGDTTEMIWSNKSMRDGTGPIGNFKKGVQGFCIHTTLAIRFDQELSVIGLANQTYFNRSKTAGKSRKDYKEKIKRESDIWYEVTNDLPPPLKNVKWTRICDSAADFYEVLLDCQIKGFGYIIRACQNRRVEGESVKLFEVPAELYGAFDLELRGREQKKK
jgi:hypothetical protein